MAQGRIRCRVTAREGLFNRAYSNGVKNRNKIFVAKLIILTYLLKLNLSNDCFSTTIYLLPVQCDIGTIKLIFLMTTFYCNPLFRLETFLHELFFTEWGES